MKEPFLVVALLIKVKALIPTLEDPDRFDDQMKKLQKKMKLRDIPEPTEATYLDLGFIELLEPKPSSDGSTEHRRVVGIEEPVSFFWHTKNGIRTLTVLIVSTDVPRDAATASRKARFSARAKTVARANSSLPCFWTDDGDEGKAKAR